jgi:hypothetical protein
MLLEPLVVMREHPFQWVRPEIDLTELAKLRFIEGWAITRLCRHFSCHQAKVYSALKLLEEQR